MAVTISLSDEAEAFARSCVEDGQASTIAEVVELALQQIEAQRDPAWWDKHEAFRAHVAEGIEQADRGEFVSVPTVGDLMAEARRRNAASEQAAE